MYYMYNCFVHYILYIYTYSRYICLYTQLLVAFFNYKKPLSYALLPWYIPIHNNNPLVKEEKWCQIILILRHPPIMQRSLNINTICVYSYFFKEYINKSHPLLVYIVDFIPDIMFVNFFASTSICFPTNVEYFQFTHTNTHRIQ